ncbi:MAG: WecB/TagA/CpsF family glycosyltransferase [Acidobacteria bacterium]|jgi:N-acetylglucosaminyldiphosphoundecaprenol N-acetyl-beta-D-mannosaminyltransferase|nr:WecB/TagA/CpsF family glycosyltransferase [Acidobacteriota bacterium]
MSNQPVKNERVKVVSLQVNVCNHDSAIQRVAELVRRGRGGYVCFSTVHMTMESFDNPEYAVKVNAADLIIPDGMPLVWMQKLQGEKQAARVRANDLMIMLCAYAEKNNLTVGFYGGKQIVIDAILERAKKDYPKLKIVYAFSPPFRPLTEEEDAAVIAEINEKKPDILFMGLGCPKQENWMSAHKGKLTAVMLGVGASFDFFAGNVRESPEWLGRLGLEWLFRLTQEPRRLWKRYLILNPRFMRLATLQLLRSKK